MIIAWAMCSVIGTFIARYFKGLMGDGWFQVLILLLLSSNAYGFLFPLLLNEPPDHTDALCHTEPHRVQHDRPVGRPPECQSLPRASPATRPRYPHSFAPPAPAGLPHRQALQSSPQGHPVLPRHHAQDTR